jgi:hypothetical protein
MFAIDAHDPSSTPFLPPSQLAGYPTFITSTRPSAHSLLGSFTRFGGARRRAPPLVLVLALLSALFLLDGPASHARALLRDPASEEYLDSPASMSNASTSVINATPIPPPSAPPQPEPIVFSLIMFSANSAREGAVLMKVSPSSCVCITLLNPPCSPRSCMRPLRSSSTSSATRRKARFGRVPSTRRSSCVPPAPASGDGGAHQA